MVDRLSFLVQEAFNAEQSRELATYLQLFGNDPGAGRDPGSVILRL